MVVVNSVKNLTRASLRLLTRSAEHGANGPPQDSDFVSYRGISVNFLRDLKEQLINERAAPGINLFVATEDIAVRKWDGTDAVVQRGSTVRVKSTLRDGTMKCSEKITGLFDLPEHAAIEYKPRCMWSMEDVCMYFVIPQTHTERVAYIELMKKEDVGGRFKGAFLSVARKSCFSDTIDALVAHYDGKHLHSHFVWLDIFCSNQAALVPVKESLAEIAEKARQDILSCDLHNAIYAFDECLMFFNSWIDPHPLERSWCIWEMVGCMKSGKSFEALFQPGEDEIFLETVLRDGKQVSELMQRITNFRLEETKSFFPSDKAVIDAVVEEHLGHHNLNAQVSEMVQHWLGSFVEHVVARLRESPRSSYSTEFAVALSEAGNFLGDQLALYDQALRLLKESLHVFKRATGEVNEVVADVLHSVATFMHKSGDYDGALQVYEDVLHIEAEVRGVSDHPVIAQTLQDIASVLRDQGRYDFALLKLDESLRLLKSHFGETHISVAQALDLIASVLHEMEDHDEALEKLQESMAMKTDLSEDENLPSVASTLFAMAAVLKDQGEYDEAMDKLGDALSIYETVYGTLDHDDVADTLHSVGTVLHAKRQYEEALDKLEESIEIRVSLHGDNHPSVAATLAEVAGVLQDIGRFDQSLQKCKEALVIEERAHYGRDHPVVVNTLLRIANVMQDMGLYDEALQQLDGILQLGNAFHYRASVLYRMASIWQDAGEYEAAMKMFYEVHDLEVHRRGGDKSHPEVILILDKIARLLQDKGDFGAAHNLLKQILTSEELMYGGRENPEVATTVFNIASVYHAQGDLAAAQVSFEDALDLFERSYGTTQRLEVAGTIHNLASVLQDVGEYDLALGKYEEAISLYTSLQHERTHPKVATTLHSIATVYLAKGEYDEAYKLLLETIDILVVSYGSRRHPNIATALQSLASVCIAKGEASEAMTHLEEVRRIESKCYSRRAHCNVAKTLIATADCLNNLRKPKQALTILLEAETILKTRPNIEYLACLYGVRGVSLRLKGNAKQSRLDLERSLEIRRQLGQIERHICVQEAEFQLALTLDKLGLPKDADVLFERLLETRTSIYHRNHLRVTEVEAMLEDD